MPVESNSNTLLVSEVRYLALGVLGLTLQPVSKDASLSAQSAVPRSIIDSGKQEPLASWEPGAHIDIVLPSGATRSYSLCGDPDRKDRYEIAVLHDANGRGGSAEIHRTQLVGQTLTVIGPRNTFALVPAKHYVFIAGGIGITPLLPMIKVVAEQGGSYELHYLGRSRASMAFVDRVDKATPPGANVTIIARDQDPPFDANAVLATIPANSTVYCCGPERLMSAVEDACLAHALAFHAERFGRPTLAPLVDAAMPNHAGAAAQALDDTAKATEPTTSIDPDQGFEVVLQRSGTTLTVGPGESILEVVRQVRRDLTFSCSSGYCGTCETRVLSGIPAHRDEVLSDEEKAGNQSMMICVGRSCTQKLVLDL